MSNVMAEAPTTNPTPPPSAGKPQRIAVIGCSGSGKSTLAALLAKKLALPFVPTDAAFWAADWRPIQMESLRDWLDEQTSAPAWVTDGNFDPLRDILWARADLVVWLDLPLATTLWRVASRNIVWWWNGTPVWGGKRMTPSNIWNGTRHAAKSHDTKHRTYPKMLAALPPSVTVVRIQSPQQLSAWLDAFN
jgi:hypothetical protein